MTSGSSIPEAASTAVETWLTAHDEVAPGLVEGLYLVGSLALDDWQPRCDVDIVAFTADPATDDDAAVLEVAHRVAIERLSGVVVDGPRLAWGDVTVPAMALHRPWTLDGEFHHDGECFELNPVTWNTLATSGVAVRGPACTELGVALDDGEVRSFVRENVDTYWRSIAEAVAVAGADRERTWFEGAMQEWCILGVARMLVTFETGEVVSKTVAGERLIPRLEEYRPLIEQALAFRRAPVEPEPVDRATVAATADLMSIVIDTIAS